MGKAIDATGGNPANLVSKIFLLGLPGSRDKNAFFAQLQEIHDTAVTRTGDHQPCFTDDPVQSGGGQMIVRDDLLPARPADICPRFIG